MGNIFEINRASNKITLGTTGTTINVASHTASKILALDGSKDLEVVTIGSSLDYTRPTLNTVQDIRTSASPTFVSINLTDNTGLIDVDGNTFLANDGTGNIFLGEDAFNDNTGSYNIGIGYQAGYYNDLTGGGSRGTYNIYIGYLAGNGAAAGNTGYHNLAIGALSLDANTSGYQNVALSGVNALRANTSGYQNIAIGFDALRQNTSGYKNTAIGYSCGKKITTGFANTVIGWGSLITNVSGTENTAIGTNVLKLATGSENIVFGSSSLMSMAAGEQNAVLGLACLFTVTEANRCIAIGYKAGYRQTGTVEDKLFIDDRLRANAAEELTNAIIYGVMAATPADQTLRVNAVLTVAGEVEAGGSTTKIKLTSIGGYAIKLTNKTGSNTIAGQVVKADIANNDAVVLTSADELEAIGIFLDSGVAEGSEAWVVVAGIADVAMEDNTAATRGNWVRVSITETGYADATNADAPQPINQTHFTEVGHCIETVSAGGAGTHILARCILQFN